MIFRVRFLFIEFKNRSSAGARSCFAIKLFDFFFILYVRPQHGVSIMNINIVLIFVTYLNGLQFKFALILQKTQEIHLFS